MQLMPWAFCLLLVRAGKSMAARMAIMAMTTSNSIKVKARARTVTACFSIVGTDSLRILHSISGNSKGRTAIQTRISNTNCGDKYVLGVGTGEGGRKSEFPKSEKCADLAMFGFRTSFGIRI